MIKLKNILTEQIGSFQDLGDGYMVMKDPKDVPDDGRHPSYGSYGSFNLDAKGFTFSSNDKVATKQYKGSELKLVWKGAGKFNVFYYNKDQGVFTFDSFGDWLEKKGKDRDVILANKPTLDKLKEMGFKASKDPVSGYNSYVKYVKTWWADTATAYKPKGYWKCNTAIRVFNQSADKWVVRAQIIPDSFDDSVLLALKQQDVINHNVSNYGTNQKKTSWLTGREYKEFVRTTPEMAAKQWDRSISQAIRRVQRMSATTNTLIDKVSKLEADIHSFKGLVGPYDDPKFRYNYLMQTVHS